MSWEQIQTTIVGLAVSAIVAIVGRYFGVKMSAQQKTLAQWAVEQGVAYAAFKLGHQPGNLRKAEAVAVAKSLAPRALQALDASQTNLLVESTYARLKPSLPTPAETAAFDIPVDVVDVEAAPTPLPRPKIKPS